MDDDDVTLPHLGHQLLHGGEDALARRLLVGKERNVAFGKFEGFDEDLPHHLDVVHTTVELALWVELGVAIDPDKQGPLTAVVGSKGHEGSPFARSSARWRPPETK